MSVYRPLPSEHTTPKKQTVKQTAAPEYTDQPAPHLLGSELQFVDEGEDLEQTDPGVDTNPDAGNVEQDEAEVGVLPANQAVNEIPALPMPYPAPQDRRYPWRDRRPPQLYGQPFF